MPNFELKDVATFLDIAITDTTTIDEFKESVNKKFVPADRVNTAVGEITGKALHAIKKEFKSIGLEVDAAELKDKAITDIPALFASAAKAKFDELEKAKGMTTEQAEAKFRADLEKAHKQINDLTGLHTATVADFEAFKTDVVTKERNNAIGSEFNKVFGSLKFSETKDQYAIKGFKAELTETYKFDIDEKGSPIVRDAKGDLIKSKVKVGEPASFEEVITNKFIESKMGAVADSKKAPTFGAPPTVFIPPTKGAKQPAPRH
jgi:hypothetical protein